MENITDTEMLRIFGRSDPDTVRDDKIHNDGLQRMLDEEYFSIVEDEYEWMRSGQTVLDLIERIKIQPAPVILYGASRGLLKTLKYTKQFNINAHLLCDQNWEAAKNNKYGCTPISLETLMSEHMNSYILITIETYYAYLDAYHSLLARGFPKDRLFAIRLYDVRW